jgi:acyl-coenzyme A thioesterase PaaI-like protein
VIGAVKKRLLRHAINFYPAYFGSGGRVKYIADDWREVRMELPYNWRTKGSSGALFGGSIYAAIDPFYAMMVAKNVGAEFVVWDKAARIRYRRPGRGTLHARFVLEDGEVEEILAALRGRKSVDRVYVVELVDEKGEAHAIIEKTVYVGWRSPPEEVEGRMIQEREIRRTEKEAR